MERYANEYSELFYHCVQVLNEYKENVSEDIFLDEYFQINKVPNQSFISTILIDCCRHSAFLKIIVDIFYKTNGINIRRSEQNIYKVITYLIFFQIDSIGIKVLRAFINSVQLFQMSQFLNFLINENHLLTIKTECLKLYDQDYVEKKILGVIQIHLPDLRGILLDITNFMEGRSAPRQLPETTKTKPFNFTPIKPRTVHIPKIIPKIIKSRPPPKSTYEPAKESIELERKREENHFQSLKKLNDVRSLSFHVMQTDKSIKTQQRQAKLLEDNEKNLHHDSFKANPLPKFQTNKFPIKLNVATVLKESQLYKRQEDEIRRRLNEYESGTKDDHEFFQWQQTMLQRDYEQQLNAIERKRLEGKICFEEAILAKQRLIDENRQIADEIKRETRQAIQNHIKEKIEEEQRLKQLVEDVINARDNGKIAQQKLQQYKADFVKQYREEIKQSLKQALEETENEMRQRAELIRQIRTYELFPVDRRKQFDFTSVPGYGLHDEMSLVELHERLEILKLERERERENRHEQIVKEKQFKEKIISNTVQQIAKYRNDLTTQAVLKKHRNRSAPTIVEKPNAEIQQLKTYLESKKAERVSKKQHQSSFSSEHSFLSRSHDEWNRFHQLEKSSDKTQKRIAPTLIA